MNAARSILDFLVALHRKGQAMITACHSATFASYKLA